MIHSFLLEALLTNHVYLGYTKAMSSPVTAFYSSGLRNNVQIHNLNMTISLLSAPMKVLESVVFYFNTNWIVVHNKQKINNYYNYFFSKINELRKYCSLWSKSWVPGFLLNRNLFTRLCYTPELTYIFPNLITYMNSTRFQICCNEARQLKILQIGVLDSNSTNLPYEYIINANEKTRVAEIYFIKLLLSTAFRSLNSLRRFFIIAGF